MSLYSQKMWPVHICGLQAPTFQVEPVKTFLAEFFAEDFLSHKQRVLIFLPQDTAKISTAAMSV
jgi:hypothetical protein